ncbi:HpcH/HpaI aldolase family protein [Devosia sp. SL43]|uniref:HpcH/HpaI aldolase family protein n=1 Tax=Devosia sp. SL43 TaxID=2806348 RepID=UPI001F2BC200|nr:HpcH/HpaI aldolase/citrate lyase family protein [Devosia sp. SL43]UJW86428.1 HpcH/HpaI aldolase/citrate lyase family protein [Devosia sp. SL43]
MELAHNAFKAALKAGKSQLGIWSSLVSPMVAEILGQSAFDWILFDAEHSPVDLAGLYPLLQACASGKAHAAVRPPWNDMVMVKRVLDMGAQTVLLPFVQNPAEAAAAVASTRYPPDGVRGVAVATRAGGYGRRTGYLTRAGDDVCTLVQVETAEALAQLDAIAATPDLDGVFIGPSDLAASMGYLGQPGHPEVQAAIQAAVKTILAQGRAPGILALTAADARRYLDWGYLFVACGLDIRLLVQGVDALHNEVTR